MFEFVKILNEEEARKWWEFIFKKQEEKAMKCQTAIRQNSDLLLMEYDNYLRELQETEKAEKQSIEQMIELFEHKKCYCGGKLRYISTYDFWGCENYKDTSQKHLTINNENYWKEAAENYRLSVPAHWLSHIIDRANLRNNVTSKRLLEFYLEIDQKEAELKALKDRYQSAWENKQRGLLAVTEDGEELQLPTVSYRKSSMIVKFK